MGRAPSECDRRAHGDRFLVSAALAIAAIARHWDSVEQPALWVGVGTAAALVLLGLWLWIGRSDFTAPEWLNVPVWALPIAAIGVAVYPSRFPHTVSLLAYGFLAPYLLGCVAFSVYGRIEARRHVPEERRRRGLRALRWMDRQP